MKDPLYDEVDVVAIDALRRAGCSCANPKPQRKMGGWICTKCRKFVADRGWKLSSFKS